MGKRWKRALQARRIEAAKEPRETRTEEFIALAPESTVDVATVAAPVEVVAEMPPVATKTTPKSSKSTRKKTTQRKTTTKKRTSRAKTTNTTAATAN